MNSAIITSKSNKDLKLLLELAKKLNIKSKILTKEEEEDLGLIKAMTIGRTKQFVDTKEFLKKIA